MNLKTNPDINDTEDDPVQDGKWWNIWMVRCQNALSDRIYLTPDEILKRMNLEPADWEIEPFLEQMLSQGDAFHSKGKYMGKAVDTPQMADLRSQVETRNREIAALKERLEESAKAPKKGPVEVLVRREAGKKILIKQAHFMMPELLKRLSLGVHVYLVGPAGSGKTKAAEMVADALGVKFGFMSVGPQTTKTDIFGYMSASGKYIGTEYRKRYEHGGLYLWDEMDAGNPGVATSVNASLAGQYAAFPDGMIKRHANFCCIAAGNTYGTGPDRQYVGREPMDAATRDRFDFLEWPYDEGLERTIADAISKKAADRWVPYVQAARAAASRLGIQHVISPRASFSGTTLLSGGLSLESVKASTLWKGLNPATVTRIESEMGVVS
jgi:cobaltochelatase CobS